MSYQTSTIRRSATILANTDPAVLAAVIADMQARSPRVPAQPKAAPAPRKAAAKAAKADWRTLPATNGQVARINRAEKALGMRISPRTVLGTGQDARNLWNGLKADLNRAGIRLA